MSIRNKPERTASSIVRLRSTTKADAEKAVAVKTIAGESTNLSQFVSDITDAATAPILRAAGIPSSRIASKAKVTK